MSKTEADAIIGEISILKKLKHDFIVEMKDFNWDSNFIYIVMEYCGGETCPSTSNHTKSFQRKFAGIFYSNSV